MAEAQDVADREPGNPDDHRLMPHFGLRAIGPEEAVPPGQGEPEVAVCLHSVDRVVHAVHVRRDDHHPQETIRHPRYPQVGVAPERPGIQHDLENDDSEHRRAEEAHDRTLEPCRQKNLDGMKPYAGRHVQLGVRVMDAVQSPEGGEGVKEHVLQVHGEVEDHDGCRDAHPDGYRPDRVEQAPAPVVREPGHGDGAREWDGPNDYRAHDDEPEVADPPAPAPDRTTVAGQYRLEGGEEREEYRERSKPEESLRTRHFHTPVTVAPRLA